MSALPPKADIGKRRLDVCIVPNSDIAPKSVTVLARPTAAELNRPRQRQNSLT
jgi:hypothetical protein